ncbi:purine nucleoside permease [Dacryopinax primogenitus]|uniref:Purine nucleoside permease n=1 Tax=Dacryopinax primogenitus (strain DJM 731) TaxID=1858805 RepID=M5FWZ5_DACPD|nr:purine nucleoside permease [Dacryopinax primogenitus]EJU00210.1 purine nucleoside permease [Dacryopinax primogenitus]
MHGDLSLLFLCLAPFLVLASPSGKLMSRFIPQHPPKHYSWPLAPRITIISMFTPEEGAWLVPLDLKYNISVPGLSMLYPHVHCDDKGWICQMTTGESEINAAASTTALFFSPYFDFTSTYFMIVGIAGGNPYYTTTGSAANWTTGYFGFGTTAPDMYPGMSNWYGTEVFELNTNLLARVMDVVKDVKLNDTADAAAFAPANLPPTIVQCDVATSDVWFSGAMLSEAMGNITEIWTNGTGKYCTTAEEDNATLESAVRAHLAGMVDYSRFILLRTVSDFDRQPPNVTAYDSLTGPQGGFEVAITNIFSCAFRGCRLELGSI